MSSLIAAVVVLLVGAAACLLPVANRVRVDLGRCVMCGDCIAECPTQTLSASNVFRLASALSNVNFDIGRWGIDFVAYADAGAGDGRRRVFSSAHSSSDSASRPEETANLKVRGYVPT